MYMNTIFANRIQEMYFSENISALSIKTEIKKIIKSKNGNNKTEYYDTYQCSFEDGDSNISIWGQVRFNENFDIVKMPDSFGKNKYDISVSIITINGIPVTSNKVNKNKYVLDKFSNRNNFSK